MAYSSYSGRHSIVTRRRSNSCMDVLLRKKPSYGDNMIGSVCKVDGGWDYTYVGTRARLGPVRSARDAIKRTVSGYRSWIGEDTQMGRARRRRR